MNVVKKYLKLLSMGFQSGIEYRADFFLRIVSGMFVIIVQCFLWTAVFKSSQDAVIYGYTYGQMITYVIIAALVAQMSSTGFQWEIAYDVKDGGLSKFLAQPVNYTLYRVFSFFGKKISQIFLLTLMTVAVLAGCAYFLDFELSLTRILMFLVFIIFSIIINFLIYYCLSTLAFVMLEVWGVFTLANQTILFLSGGVFPLDVFGEKMNAILAFLPFKYIVYYPINVLNGRLTWEDMRMGVMVEMVWIILLAILACLLWKKNMKKYVAVGG